MDNAVKFSENESSVIIEVTQRSDKVFVSVKDSGLGIPRKELNKIWERFYKSDLSRGKDKGTGLGLALLKKSSRLMMNILMSSVQRVSELNLSFL